MKRKILILSVVAICIAILTAGTVAFFTAEETAHNVITTGGVKIALQEWSDEDKTQPFEDVSGVMPNMTVTKIAEVKNTGSAPAWVRVKVEKDIELDEEIDAAADPDLVVIDVNTEKWELGADGFLYYKEALEPGETTGPVFTSVTFKAEMGNDYQGATATVDVTAQAVQTANNGTTYSEAAGWPAA